MLNNEKKNLMETKGKVIVIEAPHTQISQNIQ